MSNYNNIITFQEEASLQDIRDIFCELQSAQKNFDTFAIDLRAVKTVDVSVLQMLAAANTSATSAGGKVTLLIEPGSPFEATAAAAGFLEMRSAESAGEDRSGFGEAAAEGVSI